MERSVAWSFNKAPQRLQIKGLDNNTAPTGSDVLRWTLPAAVEGCEIRFRSRAAGLVK
jgi:hypothetical protein